MVLDHLLQLLGLRMALSFWPSTLDYVDSMLGTVATGKYSAYFGLGYKIINREN